MKIFYSPSSQGFYVDSISKDIPEDKIEISQEEHTFLLSSGGSIALGPSGKPEIKPSRFHTLTNDGAAWEVTSENETAKIAEESEQARLSKYQQGKESSGLKGVTVEQARTWVDNKLDSAGTTAEKIEAMRDIFHKIVVFLV